MSEYQIRRDRQTIPIVAFYSVQGGVGKTTLARKFAELVTLAPGRDGHKPNVLVIDLDVGAGGMTHRYGIRHYAKTVHEMFAQRNVANAEAVDLTANVALSSASGQQQRRGHLFLLPAAPPHAKGLFETLANIDRQELLQLMQDLIRTLVHQYDISCVVIDCAPGADPYTAAAAALADVPLLIGRNEQATYMQISQLPERFREIYPQFQPAKQRVIINSVAVKDLFETRKEQYAIFDYIPLVSDVIHETEGLMLGGSFRLLLFEKYIVDIIRQVFVGRTDLIPETPDVLGQEWIEALARLQRCEEAPKMRRLRAMRHLRWIGGAIGVLGALLMASEKIWHGAPPWLFKDGLWALIAGLVLFIIGWISQSERHRILASARELVLNGPDHVFRKLQEGTTHRRSLEAMRKLADTVPPLPPAPPGYVLRGAS